MRAWLVLLVALTGCRASLPDDARGAEIPLRFESDGDRARLQVFERHVPGRRGGHDAYGTLCAAPCAITVHDWSVFRVDGDGIPTSSSFTLRAGGPTSVRVREGTTWASGVGLGLVGLGGVVIGPSTAAMAVDPDARRDASYAAAGALAAIGVGLVVLLTSGTTVDVRASR